MNRDNVNTWPVQSSTNVKMAASRSLSPLSESTIRLSIRSDTDKRYINIRIEWTSLFLLIWLWIGATTIIFVLLVWLKELRRLWMTFSETKKIARSQQQQQQQQQQREYDCANDIVQDEGNHHDDGGSDHHPLLTLESRQNMTTTATATTTSLCLQVLLVCTWGVSTVYGVFYCFYVIFLYMNDRWYQLLALQSFLFGTDFVAWMYLFNVQLIRPLVLISMKNAIKSRTPSASATATTSSTAADGAASNVALGIKFFHAFFNVIMEAGKITPRNGLFLLEDLTYIAMASRWLGTTVIDDVFNILMTILCRQREKGTQIFASSQKDVESGFAGNEGGKETEGSDGSDSNVTTTGGISNRSKRGKTSMTSSTTASIPVKATEEPQQIRKDEDTRVLRKIGRIQLTSTTTTSSGSSSIHIDLFQMAMTICGCAVSVYVIGSLPGGHRIT